jgi:hypothetical protein
MTFRGDRDAASARIAQRESALADREQRARDEAPQRTIEASPRAPALAIAILGLGRRITVHRP